MPRERTGDGIHQDAKGRLTTLTAGVPKRQDALNPVMAFFTGSPIGTLAPQDSKAQGTLSSVVCGFDPVLHKKHPQRGHLTLQASGQPTGIIFSLVVTRNQGAKPRIPRIPLPATGRRFGHMTQALQLRQGPRPTRGKLGIAFFRQATGRADEMGSTGLTPIHPV